MFEYYFKHFFSHIQKSFLIKKFIFKKMHHTFVKEITKQSYSVVLFIKSFLAIQTINVIN